MTRHVVRVKRVLPADVARVFAAWSSAEQLSQWFTCDPEWEARAISDFRVGGRYRVEMRSGGRTVGVASGEYREIDPPRRLVFTWTSDGRISVRDTIVTIDFRANGDRTEISLTHDIAPDTPEGRAHSAGWDGCLTNLEHHVRSTTMRRGAVASKTRKASGDGERRFEQIVAAFAADARLAPIARAFEAERAAGQRRRFGSNALKVKQKIFAMQVKGRLVVKLATDRVRNLVESRDGEYFDPGHGRPMKQWVVIRSDRYSWLELAKEAHDFVRQHS